MASAESKGKGPASTNAELSAATAHESSYYAFYTLLRRVKQLVREHGIYTICDTTKILTRAPIPPASSLEPSDDDMLASLAAAQDSQDSVNMDWQVRSDFVLFTGLWELGVAVLEGILEQGMLNKGDLGWGIYGIATGYIPPSSKQKEIFDVDSYTDRLLTALMFLPTIDGPGRNKYMVDGQLRDQMLDRAVKERHMCTTLLVQHFRRENWNRIRWWHVIAVLERWLPKLGFSEESVLNERL